MRSDPCCAARFACEKSQPLPGAVSWRDGRKLLPTCFAICSACSPTLRCTRGRIRLVEMTVRSIPFVNATSRTVALLIFLLAGASCLAAQSQSPADLAVGKVLVAASGMPDPVFAQSVILLVHYDKSGSLGLMVNHRTRLPISQVLSQIKAAAKRSDPVFAGGPVEMATVFALVRTAAKPAGADPVLGQTYFISSKMGLVKALGKASKSSDFRVYLGYCGWAPQQLESEVSAGRWYIFEGTAALAFDAEPDTLWTRMIAQAEGRLALLTLLGK